MPPASRTTKIPAAISHGFTPLSQNPSNLPAATYAKSKAALPKRRIPAEADITAPISLREVSCSKVVPRPLNGIPVANIDWENFARYDSAFQSLSGNMTDYDISIDGTKEGSNINYSIDIVNENDSLFYGHSLHVFIVEDSILTTWNYQGSGDSLAFARNVVRDWFTDSLSYDSLNGNQTFSGSFVVDQSQWNTDQIKIIAIIQDELTNEVYQAAQQNVHHFESLDIDQNSSKESPNIPLSYFLYQNHPNPFNPTTRIDYKLPADGFVSINIIDIMGREIKSLVNTNQVAGFKSVQWNATNNLDQPVSAGMYIYTIQAGEFRQTRKMVLLK